MMGSLAVHGKIISVRMTDPLDSVKYLMDALSVTLASNLAVIARERGPGNGNPRHTSAPKTYRTDVSSAQKKPQTTTMHEWRKE
jgi:hypothetical protein